MFKRLAIAAVSFVAIGSGVLAQSNPSQPAADTVTKVHALGDGGAIIEGNHGDDYAVWRVDASFPGFSWK